MTATIQRALCIVIEYVCIIFLSLEYLVEHSEVSQARSLRACWTRMLYHDRLETIENSQSTNSAKTLKIFNVYSSLGLQKMSHDVTKIQTRKLTIIPRFYFHDVLQQLKTNFHKNFRFKRVLGFVIEYAWISKLLSAAVFTWRPRELSLYVKKMTYFGEFCHLNSSCIRKSITLIFMSSSKNKFTLL